MGQELQAANHNQRLAEWGKRVEACRNSGQTVSQWCSENGVTVSTYFSWQRKVFQAVTEKAEVCFAEVPMYSGTPAAGSRVKDYYSDRNEVPANFNYLRRLVAAYGLDPDKELKDFHWKDWLG